jgi:hypothetical protein
MQQTWLFAVQFIRQTFYRQGVGMRSYRFLLAAVLIYLFAALTGAQDLIDGTEGVNAEDYNRIEVTTRVNEFGRVGDIERRKQLDNFLIELQNNPGATGYIIFYQGKDALPSQYGLKGEQIYLSHIQAKNYETSGIVFVDAFREHQATEFWIVPAGCSAPQPTAVIAPLEVPKNDTFLFHRSHFDFSADQLMLPSVIKQRELSQEEYMRDNGDFVNAEEETAPAVIEKSPDETNVEMFLRAGNEFAEKFKADPDGRGVVIFYADDNMFDVKKLDTDMQNRIAALAARAGLAPNKFQVIFGGYRRGIEVEMWIVPKTAKSPLAKPAARQSNFAD